MESLNIQPRPDDAGTVLTALVAADGAGAHPHLAALMAPAIDHQSRQLHDLADAVHYLCLLHGRHPGVIDHAASRSAENASRLWLIRATDAFVQERTYLTQLSVALGPAPSTSGQNASDATVLQQRHALDMLAQSDRRGCAMGAALTLAIDWLSIRALLDTAARRVGVPVPSCGLPDQAESSAVADALAQDDGIARAVQFGARQLLSQHRGLWDLLQARASVRAAA